MVFFHLEGGGGPQDGKGKKIKKITLTQFSEICRENIFFIFHLKNEKYLEQKIPKMKKIQFF